MFITTNTGFGNPKVYKHEPTVIRDPPVEKHCSQVILK